MHFSLLAATLPLAMASSVLKQRDCQKFERTDGARRGIEHSGPQAKTSDVLECQATCTPAQGPHGIIFHSTLNVTTDGPDASQAVFELLNGGAGGIDARWIDFNETIVMNITNQDAGRKPGHGASGYWTFRPSMRCFEGVLNDCGDGGSGGIKSGTPIRACGYKLIENGNDELGKARYDGHTEWVGTGGDGSDGKADSESKLPSYDEVADQATAAKAKKNGGAGWALEPRRALPSPSRRY
ncbi:hypothetical protein PG993_002196 [Apiospora rasikravindrae]|uniref:Uncharacterized protein n=1 Tax=Apiospora rasikravindrae TaxID=990691 RepID=A0ABR1UDJ3_9PEZI